MVAQRKSRRIATPPIVMAASDGELAVVKAELKKKGANVDAVDRGGGTALHQAACNHHVHVVAALLHAGADARIADDRGWTALHFAARELQPEIAKLLIEAGAEVGAQDQNGNTPLFEAVFATEDDPATIQLLVAAGADMKRKNKHGVSPLGLAQDVDHPNLEKWLRSAPPPAALATKTRRGAVRR
jgi:ankyrin repeat protein